MALRNTLDWDWPDECARSTFPPRPWQTDVATFPASANREPAARCSKPGEPVRTGERSVRFELHKGDNDPRGGTKPPGGSTRAELTQKGKENWAKVPSEWWYGFSIYLPDSWASDVSPEIVTQWHQEADVGGSPPLAIMTRKGNWEILQSWTGNKDGTPTPIGPYQMNRWTDWVVHVKWSAGSDGLLQIWKDGQPVPGFAQKSGRNTYDVVEGNKHTYMKIGIYKWDWCRADDPSQTKSRLLFHDEVRIADGPNGSNVVAPQSGFYLPVVTALGATMVGRGMFVTASGGVLRQRSWNGADWAWVDHGRPPGTAVASAPGAPMMDQKLFVAAQDGRLFERYGPGGTWTWVDHGRPENVSIVHAPGAAMLNQKLFVVIQDGRLFERHWRGDLSRWVWFDHGRPENVPIARAPGAAMLDEKLFVTVQDGRLFERHWRRDLGRWAWADHGRPPGTEVATGPGAALEGRRLFVGTKNGRLFERSWNGAQWTWVDHETPPGTTVASVPEASPRDLAVFVRGANGNLFGRRWRHHLDPPRWVWVDFGQPPDWIAQVNPVPR